MPNAQKFKYVNTNETPFDYLYDIPRKWILKTSAPQEAFDAAEKGEPTFKLVGKEEEFKVVTFSANDKVDRFDLLPEWAVKQEGVLPVQSVHFDYDPKIEERSSPISKTVNDADGKPEKVILTYTVTPIDKAQELARIAAARKERHQSLKDYFLAQSQDPKITFNNKEFTLNLEQLTFIDSILVNAAFHSPLWEFKNFFLDQDNIFTLTKVDAIILSDQITQAKEDLSAKYKSKVDELNALTTEAAIENFNLYN